jgi:hypothetical protein
MADVPENDPERLDLSAFEAPPAPPELADRVLARLGAEGPRAAPRPSRWRAVAAVAAVLLVALPGLAWWLGGEGPSSGGRAFTQRETVRLGGAALAVAEPGAELRWAVGRRGAVRVHQPLGRVFYRVDSGSDFQVDTPAGQVAVRGTCFTIEVQSMLPSKSALTGAAVGAALTAAVFVTVHEGRVALTSPAGATEVAAGERAVMAAGAPTRVLAAPAPSAPGASEPSGSSASPTQGAAPSSWQEREASYVAELTTLRARVKELEQATRQGTAPGQEPKRDGTWLEPSREELLEMARSCKLRWDEPSLRQRSVNKPTPEQLKQLNMTEEEAEVLFEVHQAFTTETLAQLRAIYVAATGDEEGARVMSPEAMKQEVFDKSPGDATKLAYQRVSQERAGLAAPPADTSALTPVERLVRFSTGLGDAYERALATKLGATRARELRRLNGGWGERHDSSVGCPAP